ncbi:hypothetical protein UT300012_22030 [Paraclostridium bifermentans]
MQEAKEFHRQRIAFAIVNGEVLYLENSELSHIGWLVGSGLVTAEEFIHVTRGYYKDGIIAFYSGNFKGGTTVERDALEHVESIIDYLDINEVKSIYCGVQEGEIGTVWEPIKTLEIGKDCDIEIWESLTVNGKVEIVNNYLDTVWNNDVLLNLRLLRDNLETRIVRQETLDILNGFKDRLLSTWNEDDSLYVEKINSTVDRIYRVQEILEIFIGE